MRDTGKLQNRTWRSTVAHTSRSSCRCELAAEPRTDASVVAVDRNHDQSVASTSPVRCTGDYSNASHALVADGRTVAADDRVQDQRSDRVSLGNTQYAHPIGDSECMSRNSRIDRRRVDVSLTT